MQAELKVEVAGASTTIQDQGRPGYQRYGIPVGGALDRVALVAANIVVGNDPVTAALECIYKGPSLRVIADSVRIAVAGAYAHLEICDSRGTRRIVPSLESTLAYRDEVICVRQNGPGVSAYLAIEEGFAVPAVMGSRSTFARAKLGGYKGRALRCGDALPIVRSEAAKRCEFRLANASLSPSNVVRILPSPQIDRFQAHGIEALCKSPYKISPACDRMGMQLKGASIAHGTSADIVSEAVVPGSVQVPGDGQPIILLADSQTTGGYAKVGVVISADLPLLGRLGAGQEISFSFCGMEEARAAQRAASAQIAGWQHKLQTIKVDMATERLLSINLVGGICDAWEAVC